MAREINELNDWTIDPERLWPGADMIDMPIAFVDLIGAKPISEGLRLPSCPVIGLGALDHPLAANLDAVIEPPVDAAGLARQVLRHPKAAAVTVQLLRILPSLDEQAGLTAESMAYGLLQGSDEHRAWIARRAQAASGSQPQGAVAVSRLGGTLAVALVRPRNGNAIDRAMRDQLYEAFALAALDPEIELVRLRGEGRTFSLGAELGEFGTTTDPATAHAIRALSLPARMLARIADKFEVHVEGACIGAGLEMAAWGRRVTASPNAWFQLPELAMGVLPGAGGCVALTRRIGRQRTALMVLSGKRFSARQALDWGLVDAIVDEPPGD